MTTALQALTPAEQKIREEGEAFIANANALAIINADSYTNAVEFGKAIKRSINDVETYFDPLIVPQRASLQALYDRKNSHIHPREAAVEIVKRKAIEWQRAERDRLAEEQRQRDALQRSLDEERRLAEAIALEAEGDDAGAAEVLDEVPPPSFTPVPVRPTPKVAGAAATKRWTFDEEAVDIAGVIKHIAGVPQDQKLAHPELACILKLNTKAIQQLITPQREHFNVPGIHAYEADGLSLSGR